MSSTRTRPRRAARSRLAAARDRHPSSSARSADTSAVTASECAPTVCWPMSSASTCPSLAIAAAEGHRPAHSSHSAKRGRTWVRMLDAPLARQRSTARRWSRWPATSSPEMKGCPAGEQQLDRLLDDEQARGGREVRRGVFVDVVGELDGAAKDRDRLVGPSTGDRTQTDEDVVAAAAGTATSRRPAPGRAHRSSRSPMRLPRTPQRCWPRRAATGHRSAWRHGRRGRGARRHLPARHRSTRPARGDDRARLAAPDPWPAAAPPRPAPGPGRAGRPTTRCRSPPSAVGLACAADVDRSAARSNARDAVE